MSAILYGFPLNIPFDNLPSVINFFNFKCHFKVLSTNKTWIMAEICQRCTENGHAVSYFLCFINVVTFRLRNKIQLLLNCGKVMTEFLVVLTGPSWKSTREDLNIALTASVLLCESFPSHETIQKIRIIKKKTQNKKPWSCVEHSKSVWQRGTKPIQKQLHHAVWLASEKIFKWALY